MPALSKKEGDLVIHFTLGTDEWQALQTLPSISKANRCI